MASDLQASASYKRIIDKVGRTVVFTRVTGVAPNATTFSAPVKAIVRDYMPERSVLDVKREGSITQGGRHLIVIENDLRLAGYPTPVVKNDKITIDGEKLNVSSVDPNKRAWGGATEILAMGV